MKPYIAALLAALILLSLVSCGRKEEPIPTEPKVITMLPLPSVEDPTLIPTEETTEATEATETETEPETEATEEITVPTEKEVGEPGKVVNTQKLNVREAPGVKSKLVTTLSYGTRVTVYEQVIHDNAKWCRIDEGWVSMEYILLDSVADSYYYKYGSQPTTAPTEETVPEESKPEESKPDESIPGESKPEESKPDESTPSESKPDESKPDESKPTDPAPTDPKPTDPPPTESKPSGEETPAAGTGE